MKLTYKLALLAAAFLSMNAVQADDETYVHCQNDKNKCSHKQKLKMFEDGCYLERKNPSYGLNFS